MPAGLRARYAVSMTLTKSTLALVCLCAFLAGLLVREHGVTTARAEDPAGFRAQDVRELLRAVEKNAEATKAVADAVRALKK
ncbi:MAG: hypothetical protein RLZZ450_7574 [Pseudomonadota bacterium]